MPAPTQLTIDQFAAKALRLFNKHYQHKSRVIDGHMIGMGKPLLTHQFLVMDTLADGKWVEKYLDKAMRLLAKRCRDERVSAFGIQDDRIFGLSGPQLRTKISKARGTCLRVCRQYSLDADDTLARVDVLVSTRK